MDDLLYHSRGQRAALSEQARKFAQFRLEFRLKVCALINNFKNTRAAHQVNYLSASLRAPLLRALRDC